MHGGRDERCGIIVGISRAILQAVRFGHLVITDTIVIIIYTMMYVYTHFNVGI